MSTVYSHLYLEGEGGGNSRSLNIVESLSITEMGSLGGKASLKPMGLLAATTPEKFGNR